VKRELPLKIAGCTLLLLADKALYWPQQKSLLVADPHFGKAAAYRALGQPVPHGTTATNLSRLDALLANYPTTRLFFLGDFLHAPQSHAPATLAALHEWRQRHAGLACTLIRGNHDRRAGRPPATLDMEIVAEQLVLGPFALRHIPAIQDGHHVIAGHLHPVFQLHGKGRQSLRLPCLHSTEEITVLPSFGDFTGGQTIAARPGNVICVTDGSGVWPVPVS
jgi:DNA ligase-associated metallophosphoesterase